MHRAFVGYQILACLAFSGLTISQLEAATKSFPYEAQTTIDHVAVHSGPGSRYYLTGELKKEQHVTVHRHDPGGWYMVAPPTGSFSLVRAEYVKKEASGFGIVSENNVVVRVGSEINDRFEVEQRRLMKGDRVKILGDHQIQDRGRVVKMYRIEPPSGEFRWVKGDLLIPVDLKLRREHDSNPFSFPSNGIEFEPQPPSGDSPDLSYPVAKTDSDAQAEVAPTQTASVESRLSTSVSEWSAETGIVANNIDRAAIEHDRRILDALDLNFRQMITKDVSEWKLRDLQHDYEKLRKTTKIEAIAHQIDLRLQSMTKYHELKSEYDSFNSLTSATDRRDAELAQAAAQQPTMTAGMFDQPFDQLSQFPPADQTMFDFNGSAEGSFIPNLGPDPSQNGQFPSMADPGASDNQFPPEPTFTPAPSPPPTAPTFDNFPTESFNQTPPGPPSTSFNSTTQSFPPSVTPPQTASTIPMPTPGVPMNPAYGQPQQAQNAQAFVGAGILQPVPGYQGQGPQFALVAPNGQLLSYVTTPQPQMLQQYVGQAVGVYGNRTPTMANRPDMISATGLAPVQLR